GPARAAAAPPAGFLAVNPPQTTGRSSLLLKGKWYLTRPVPLSAYCRCGSPSILSPRSEKRHLHKPGPGPCPKPWIHRRPEAPAQSYRHASALPQNVPPVPTAPRTGSSPQGKAGGTALSLDVSCSKAG